ncbi:MAG: PASTA domain-containing protein [Bacteroidales bacterium]|nr:PASTA domain-containing protein [Bacteroidales bacterium]
MSLRQFLISKTFLKHLGFAVVAAFIVLLLVFQILKVYTHHGEEYTLPDYKGLTVQELDEYKLGSKLEFVINDSVYDEKKEPGTILEQNPLPNSKVKEGRKIYLTIVTETPEKVKMPNLKDLSLRQSISLLETYGLEINQLKYKKDIARNAVLQQKHNDTIVEPGSRIHKGAGIDLVLGKGLEETMVEVPFLIGLKQQEARRVLYANSLNVGEQYFLDSEDTSHLRVYSTEPGCTENIRVEMGSYVDLYFRSDKNFDFQELIDSFTIQDTIQSDSTLINDEFFEEDIELE